MSNPQSITLTLDRRILEHPRAYHLRRMRQGIWLYLDLLARLPAGSGTIEVEPAAMGREMGLAEGAVRSWLGHLRKAGYLDAERLNGTVRVTLKHIPEAPAVVSKAQPAPGRFFTVRKLQDALGEHGNDEALEAALKLHPDAALKRALAATLAVPETQIRRSRLALFLYLLKHHAHET
jgi:hypothetical protein